jgi:hypothetical protein
MVRPYVPHAGDIVWISFSPQARHERAGHRPAVVVSPAAYNAKTRLMLCCPMTTQIKNCPFEVVVAGGLRERCWRIRWKVSIGGRDGPSAKGQYRRQSWRKCGPKSAR